MRLAQHYGDVVLEPVHGAMDGLAIRLSGLDRRFIGIEIDEMLRDCRQAHPPPVAKVR